MNLRFNFLRDGNIKERRRTAMTTFNDKDFNQAFEDETKRINQQLDKDILFGLVGDINTGKSSVINQLIGEPVAKVGARPGETTEVDRYVYREKIIFADTPGLDDVHTEHSEETMHFYQEADVILFFLNAAGTVFSDSEKQSFKMIEKTNENILFVLNKIDAADDIPDLVSYVKEQAGHPYRVIPISSRTGENIDKLRDAILDLLKKKQKEMQFARLIKNKASTANRWILAASGSAAAVGVVPIPGSDFVPLISIQIGLLVKLATLYEKPLSKKRAKELTIATITGNVGKAMFRQVIKLVPGAGAVAGGSIAGGMTLALGHAVKYAYENNIELNADSLNNLYKQFQKNKQDS